MRSRTGPRSAPLALALSALALAGCADAPTRPGAPPPIDPALAVVVVDAVGGAPTARAPRAARPSLSVGPGPAAAAAALTVGPPVDLGTLGGPGSTAYPRDINDLGQVVGSELFGGPTRAFLWTEAAGIRDLGQPGSPGNAAGAVNDAGHVVGQSTVLTPSRADHAFLWTADGGRDLGTLGGASSGANAINAVGQVVGHSATRRGAIHAFLWDPAAGMRDLGTLDGLSSVASDINDAGQVVGSLRTPSGVLIHPFLWDAAGGMRAIPERPGSGAARAVAINNRGQVLVADWNPTDGEWGYIWEEGRPPEPIGPLPPDVVQLTPADLNDRGQVAGTAWLAIPGQPGRIRIRAFLWERGAGLTLLPLAPGDGYSEAAALNDRGDVVGWILRTGGATERGVRWAAQPVAGRAPVVDRLHAAVLPPGVIPGLSGIWLRVRLRDPGDPGPWDWYIRWNDRADIVQDVKYAGEFAFLRRDPFRGPGPSLTVTVWATDPGGLTSEPATFDFTYP